MIAPTSRKRRALMRTMLAKSAAERAAQAKGEERARRRARMARVQDTQSFAHLNTPSSRDALARWQANRSESFNDQDGEME